MERGKELGLGTRFAVCCLVKVNGKSEKAEKRLMLVTLFQQTVPVGSRTPRAYEGHNPHRIKPVL